MPLKLRKFLSVFLFMIVACSMSSASDQQAVKQERTKTDIQWRFPRVGHTTTLLPNGNILVLGGKDQDGRLIGFAEIIDPASSSRALSHEVPLLIPRTNHTATVLTDGTVLIFGGENEIGHVIHSAEIFDPQSNTFMALSSSFVSTPRRRHIARLLPDGNVLLWGGTDQNGKRLHNGELFNPEKNLFQRTDRLSTSEEGAPILITSLPKNKARDVSVDVRFALRFSEPLQAATVNTDTVVLTGPFSKKIPSKVVPVEGGMLAFITPTTPLAEGVTYTLTLDGPTDRSGFSLPRTLITFTTKHAPEVFNPEVFNREAWLPGLKELQGDWTTGRKESPWQSLPPLKAETNVTAISGKVLKLDGNPLANVTLQVEDRSTRTDTTGRFLLTNIPAGWQVLVIDGSMANTRDKTYSFFEVGVKVTKNQTNVLPYTIWMPLLDTAHAITIPSPTSKEMVVTTPRIPGLKVIIPPNTIIRGRDGAVVKQITITPLPNDRPPFPLLPGMKFMPYFTIQPWGASVETSDTQGHAGGVRVIYPNYHGLSSGTAVSFWLYEPSDGMGWFQYGKGHVSTNATEIVPELGVALHKFTVGGYFPCWPNCPDNDNNRGDNSDDGDGDPVDLSTGLFVLEKTDLYVQDTLPIIFTRTYRQNDPLPRLFGIGARHPYEDFLWFRHEEGLYQKTKLVLSDGGHIDYHRISSGTGQTDAIFEHTATPTRYYKSKITWNGAGWTLTLKDRTTYRFASDFHTESGYFSVLEAIQDEHGNQITITRDGTHDHKITRITSPNGKWIDLTYEGDHANGYRIVQAKDHIGRVVNYTYYPSGTLHRVIDPEKEVTEYTYDSFNRMETIKDARGIVFLTNEYDEHGRVKKQTQADQTTYEFAYTLGNNDRVIRTDVKDPRGIVRRMTFNADGYSLTDTRALGTTEEQTITYEREEGTNLMHSATDALQRKTVYTYDDMGNIKIITRLAGTPEAATTTFTYDPRFNKVATITDPLNHTTLFQYDDKGNLITITNPMGKQTTLSYNSAGQVISTTDPLGKITRLEYILGDLEKTIDPLGNTTQRFTDGGGRLRVLTNALGHTTFYDYDSLNRLTRTTDFLDGVTQFDYDPNGNLIGVTDAKTNRTSYSYNAMDRLETRTDPLSKAESYLYDGNGNLTQFTDRKGQTTLFEYDALNRRKKAIYPDGATVNYIYDRGNRLREIIDSVSGTILLDYDNFDRLLSETTPQGEITYTYDAVGRRTSMRVTGQPMVNYSYDGTNRLLSVTQGADIVLFSYDDAERRTSISLPNGMVQVYTYDVASRLTGIDYKKGENMLGNLTYTYDAAGNRTEVGGSWGRVERPNPMSSATYNAANEMIRFNTNTLTYDANGNLVSDGEKTYLWDARNRLVGITGPGLTASFVYDALGRRVSKTINGVKTDYLYDGNDIVAEINNGVVTATYLRSLNIDEPFVRRSPSGDEYYLSDALGSIIALTDSTGTVTTTYSYDPFGNTTVTGTSTNPFMYTGRENDGTGLYYYRARYYSPKLQRFLSEDPMYSPTFNAKKCLSTYSPTVGRLIEMDRHLSQLMGLGFYQVLPAFGFNPQYLHLYTYTNDNPINGTDPLGLAVIFVPPAGPQNPGCDPGNWGFNSCATKCCNEHDQCYVDNSCNAGSWLPSFGLVTNECYTCNRVVVGCLIGAAIGGGGRKC